MLGVGGDGWGGYFQKLFVMAGVFCLTTGPGLRKWILSEEYKEGTLNNYITYAVERHLHSLYAITQPACTTRLCKVKSGYKTFWPFPSRGLEIFSPSLEFVAPSLNNDHSLTYRSAERFWRGSKCVEVNVFAANGVAQRKMCLARSSELAIGFSERSYSLSSTQMWLLLISMTIIWLFVPQQNSLVNTVLPLGSIAMRRMRKLSVHRLS